MTNIPVKTIIHGHFYQPPREDPWTDQIEDQPSAYPYKNWNIRITKECYEPNCFSRVLDHKGKIKDIINNYRYISFNFGPTLLTWLEKEEPEVYQLILLADRKSIKEHNGHGNAIAQIYNHVIMPLQSQEDKKTQIIWGLRDFEKRFGRNSEGIWLSETAVDYSTIDLLIDFGIKFIILSPNQAQSFRKIGEENWTNVSEQPIETKRSYKVIREYGEIAIFYFDKRLSTAVSFEHLIHDSNNFAARIMQNITDKNDLVIIASDGEVFGHHEAFGDMCLASLIKNYHINNKKIQLLNFGEYLALYPPEYETSIYLGDDGLGSSWSCAHGVGRWYKNCGCHTGGKKGWNQEWRTPLREAFDTIKKEIDEIFVKELSKYIDSPWDLRNDYIEYILDGYAPLKIDFLQKHTKKNLTKNEVEFILSLLESQKYALFMYTSCAWFFTELTGIETVQNIKYAYKAITLIEKEKNRLKILFENKLIAVKSNIPKYKNGMWILKNWIYPHIQNFSHIVNNFIALYKITKEINTSKFNIFKIFGYENFSIKKIKSEGVTSIHEGSIKLINKKGYSSKTYNFIYLNIKGKKYEIYICLEKEKTLFNDVKQDVLNRNFNKENYKNMDLFVLSEKDLLSEVKQFIIEHNYRDKIKEMINSSIKMFNDIKPLLYYYKMTEIDLPHIYKSFVKFAAESLFYNLSKIFEDFLDKKILTELIQLFNFVKHFSIEVDSRMLKEKIAMIIYNNLLKAEADLDSNIYQQLIILIEFCHKVNLVLEISRSENLIYKLLKNRAPILIEKINSEELEEKKAHFILQFRNLILLAGNFNINTDKEKKEFFEHFKKK
ncbi:MAG: DUF3536 domain-containing protein [Spirochaetes bacterium]|nr:DUF3536 domain-containing protein [Spirochaetota bacterium]